MDKKIIHLFTKYLNKQCSAEEIEEVFNLIRQGNYHEEWELVIASEADKVMQGNYEAMMEEAEISRLHDRIQSTISRNSIEKPVARMFHWRNIAAAAVILLSLSIGYYYFILPDKLSEKTQMANDIAPGGNKAVLTLANGKKITLTDAQNGTLAQMSGVSITKEANGRIVYTAGSNQITGPALNNIETPRGGQYQVVLNDGTKVLLNAASSLTFPASFAGSKERRVELKGEAYFEVAKDKAHPFVVKTNDQQVEVLGTHFNINNYADEPGTKTTLIEGSVAVKGQNRNVVLKPGEQSLLIANDIQVTIANTEEVLAWKNGYFMFESEQISSVMRKIARWYDVEVSYEGELPADNFGGSVSRFGNVSQVLKKLELTNKVHFKIEGRRIIVTR